MDEIVEELKKWREARNMQDNEFVVEEQVAYMLDECKEILLAKTDEHRAEEYCDVAILAFNGLGLLKMGYLEETIGSTSIVTTLEEIVFILYYAYVNKKDAKQLTAYRLNIVIFNCAMSIRRLGYDFQKMMLEKIKVISSREQDPEQKEEWALSGASGKWEKNKLQDKSTIYKPNFESCRLGG